MTTATSRRPRRLLTDEIDRLDGVIDGLAENLNGAVADAARAAVRDVLLAVLTDPTMRAIARQVFAPGPDDGSGPAAGE